MGTMEGFITNEERQIWEIFQESVDNITAGYDNAVAKANACYRESMSLARKNYNEGITRVKRGRNDLPNEI